MHRERFYDNDPDHSASELHVAPTFGAIFHLFFQLSPATQKELNLIQHDLELVPQQCMAVHCRVRHPKAHAKGKVVKGKDENYPADKTGLPWDEGNPMREFACQTAKTALECARYIGGDNTHKDELPIYFLADSNDLVRHVAIELQDTNGYLKHNKTGIFQPLLEEEVQALPQRRILARDVTLENVHIDCKRVQIRQPIMGPLLICTLPCKQNVSSMESDTMLPKLVATLVPICMSKRHGDPR